MLPFMAKAKKSSGNAKSHKGAGAEALIRETRAAMLQIATGIEKKYNDAANQFLAEIKKLMAESRKIAKLSSDLESSIYDECDREETEAIERATLMYGAAEVEKMRNHGQIPSLEDRQERYATYVNPLLEAPTLDEEVLTWNDFGTAIGAIRKFLRDSTKQIEAATAPPARR